MEPVTGREVASLSVWDVHSSHRRLRLATRTEWMWRAQQRPRKARVARCTGLTWVLRLGAQRPVVAVCAYGRGEGLPARPQIGLSRLVGSNACMRQLQLYRPANTAHGQVI